MLIKQGGSFDLGACPSAAHATTPP